MELIKHFWVGWVGFTLIMSSVKSLFDVNIWIAFAFLLGSVIVDIDHYIWYVSKFRKYNIVDCYSFFLRDRDIKVYRNKFLVLHKWTSLILVLVVSFLIQNFILLMFVYGWFLHLMLDGK